MNDRPRLEKDFASMTREPLQPDRLPSLEERCRDILAHKRTCLRFTIKRFKDGQNIGLPKWAKHLVIGGYAEQGWAAFDQRRNGKRVAGGRWGDSIILCRDGSIVGQDDIRAAKKILAERKP